eukprot:TRINITY_DN32645_c0_g4_i1.p1 TRINITY_DN32645_c0_g4~~TRINITY_DN32645_c0_g4_i1.p1  ORF type:complete len:415 (+),score=16.53 TRINITY_DN32645_c0_g4_i1:55-1299(+)
MFDRRHVCALEHHSTHAHGSQCYCYIILNLFQCSLEASATGGMPAFTPRICPDGENCSRYQRGLQYETSEDILRHVTTCSHPLRVCRYGNDCRAFQRVLNGDGDRFDDKHHMALYMHARHEIAKESADSVAALTMAFNGSSREWRPGNALSMGFFMTPGGCVDAPGASPPLERVLDEITRNGFGYILTNKGKNLVDIARNLRGNSRYMQIMHGKSPAEQLTDAELLMTLVYTGSDVQGDLRRWLRMDLGRDTPEAKKWGACSDCLKVAVMKLAEEPPQAHLYHGLNGVVVKADWLQYHSFISLSLSYHQAVIFAQGEGGTVEDPSSVGTVLCMRSEFFSPANPRREWQGRQVNCTFWCAADMQWLSKFTYEQEWLMVPRYIREHSGMSFKELPKDVKNGVFLWDISETFYGGED